MDHYARWAWDQKEIPKRIMEQDLNNRTEAGALANRKEFNSAADPDASSQRESRAKIAMAVTG